MTRKKGTKVTYPTDAQLAEWLELAEKATPGPWQPGFDDGSGLTEPCIWITTVEGDYPIVTEGAEREGGVRYKADALFIATAREALPATIKALQEARAAYKTTIDELHVFPSVLVEVKALRAKLDEALVRALALEEKP